MPSPLLVPFLAFARRLRYPTLFKVTAALFAISLLWPFDPIPLIDEILLGLGTLLLANWKRRGAGQAARPRFVNTVKSGGEGRFRNAVMQSRRANPRARPAQEPT